MSIFLQVNLINLDIFRNTYLFSKKRTLYIFFFLFFLENVGVVVGQYVLRGVECGRHGEIMQRGDLSGRESASIGPDPVLFRSDLDPTPEKYKICIRPIKIIVDKFSFLTCTYIIKDKLSIFTCRVFNVQDRAVGNNSTEDADLHALSDAIATFRLYSCKARSTGGYWVSFPPPPPTLGKTI